MIAQGVVQPCHIFIHCAVLLGVLNQPFKTHGSHVTFQLQNLVVYMNYNKCKKLFCPTRKSPSFYHITLSLTQSHYSLNLCAVKIAILLLEKTVLETPSYLIGRLASGNMMNLSSPSSRNRWIVLKIGILSETSGLSFQLNGSTWIVLYNNINYEQEKTIVLSVGTTVRPKLSLFLRVWDTQNFTVVCRSTLQWLSSSLSTMMPLMG